MMMICSRGTLFVVVCASLTACPADDKPLVDPAEVTTGINVTTPGSSSTGEDSPTGGDMTTLVTTTGPQGGTGEITASTSSTATTAPDPSTVGDSNTGGSTGGSTSGNTSGETTIGETTIGETTSGDTGVAPKPVACDGKIWACGDGIDNDGDGKIDNADFECISPCDDDESSFQTNLPGMAEDCKNDCYWDADSGAGQDKCEYNLQCDAQNPGGQIGCGFVKECPAQTPAQCIDVCVPLIPNGCDCFGCCHVDTPNGIKDYYLDSSGDCALDNLGACNSCTFQEQCANPCEGCEVCFGEKAPPQGCDPGDGGQCEDGVKTCTMGGDECGEFEFCQTGCCKPIVPG